MLVSDRTFIKGGDVLTSDSDKLLDEIGWKILNELQLNARLPLTELGRRVGLSTPAVGERVRRLEDAGIILAYRAQVDHAKTGYPMLAFIRISVVGDFLSRHVWRETVYDLLQLFNRACYHLDDEGVRTRHAVALQNLRYVAADLSDARTLRQSFSPRS